MYVHTARARQLLNYGWHHEYAHKQIMTLLGVHCHKFIYEAIYTRHACTYGRFVATKLYSTKRLIWRADVVLVRLRPGCRRLGPARIQPCILSSFFSRGRISTCVASAAFLNLNPPYRTVSVQINLGSGSSARTWTDRILAAILWV
jgi:hypothetical protein